MRALSALVQPLADAIPTLRVLSIADMGISTEIMAATEEACDELERARDAAEYGLGEGGDGAEKIVYEWDELRRLSHIRVQRWWRVEDDEAGRRRLVEISEAEGERAQTVIESPDWNAETGLSGTSSFSCAPDRKAHASTRQICSLQCPYDIRSVVCRTLMLST